MQVITLKTGDLSCRLAPEQGASVLSFDYEAAGKKQALLRRTVDEDSSQVTDFASWPLVPFSNRINKGRFNFGGKDYALVPDYLGPPHHASHGMGWKLPWRVTAQDTTSCELLFTFDEVRFWPFPFKAVQNFKLDKDSLTIRMSVTNTGNEDMPAGLGLHPYFPRPPGTTLQATVGHLWENDAYTLPGRRIAVPAEYEFSTPKSLDHARLDSCFDGYGGKMEIVWPKEPMKLIVESSDNLCHFVVYTPEGKDFFCAEPVSHLPDAVNRMNEPGHGLKVLRPGESMEAAWRFQVAPA